MRRRHVGSKAVPVGLFLLGLLLSFAEQPARAQTAGSGDAARFNFAFAAQLGSGIYDVSGHTVQIYRIPFDLSVREPKADAPRIWLEFPICFGFFDVDVQDETDTTWRDHFATVSLTPGVGLEFSVLRNWSLRPYVQLGVARDLHTSQSAYVYTVGVRSLATFDPGRLTLLLGNRLLYTGSHTAGVEVDDDFAMLESGFEIRSPIRRKVKGYGIDWGPYIMNYLYMAPTEVFLEGAPLDVGSQYEVGVTLGTQELVPFWRFFAVPRLGVGYRFGDGFSAVRLILGTAF